MRSGREDRSTLAALIPAAVKTGRCEIRPNSYVRKIEAGKDGRVTGAIYFDAEGREVFQRAKAVVVCANGAETPRLLLMSKSNAFPNGLGNSNGNVGKYLMFDNGGFAFGLFEHPLNEYKSVVVTRVVHDYYRSDPKRGFYGGGGIDGRMDYYPAGFALAGMPPDGPQWGSEWKRDLGQYYTHMGGALAHASCLAVEQNSISLDDKVKDAWGLPAMRVTFKNHPDDLKAANFLMERQKEILLAAGAKKVWADESYSRRSDLLAAPDGKLPHGRRSEDQRGEQVEPRARCSEFVSGGWQQPGDLRAPAADGDHPGAGVPAGGLYSARRRSAAKLSNYC